MALDPAGDDLDVVDDLARAGGRRRFGGLAEDDDPQRRRVGGARPGDGDQRREQAGEAERDGQRAARRVGFRLLSARSSNLATPALSQGCGRDSAFAARRNAPCSARLHDPGHGGLCRVASRDGGLRPRRRFHPRRPRLARDRGRRDRAGGDRRRPRDVLARRSSSCSRSTSATSSPSATPTSRRAPRKSSERARPLAARAGGGDRRRRGRPGRAARRRAGADRGAQPGAQRGRRDLPRALARDARRRARRARCAASRS